MESFRKALEYAKGTIDRKLIVYSMLFMGFFGFMTTGLLIMMKEANNSWIMHLGLWGSQISIWPGIFTGGKWLLVEQDRMKAELRRVEADVPRMCKHGAGDGGGFKAGIDEKDMEALLNEVVMHHLWSKLRSAFALQLVG